ncbi:S8/S53 family peptidase [Ramlibacter alkalitolerans]|uniref:Peptidase S8/S53 domain-containing protein n=1 Tax=Ramlibacter alkalitolerans TaxID=2039631 RepID=A0ABS1JW34_9BURK|nr:hypothetical protein [Ramlibacter alkalitolerans]MBL0428429.1 hypothetical protein [Ramlibacter alkalitolerans]
MADMCQDILGWGRVDPYLVWAEITGYAGTPRADGDWIPVIAEATPEQLADLKIEVRSRGYDKSQQVLGVPRASGPVFFTMLLAREVRCTVLELLSHLGIRWELAVPFASPDAITHRDASDVALAAEHADGQDAPLSRARSGRQVIGFIDYGCAFAHRQFRRWSRGTRTDASRVFALWDQQSTGPVAALPGYKAPDWQPVPGFGYGREWRRTPASPGAGTGTVGIDAFIEQFIHNGVLDEESCYAASGYDAVRCPVAHGTFVMDIAAGYPDPLQPSGEEEQDPEPDADIVFVQLPRFFQGRQVSGLLRSYVLDAVRYICACAEPKVPLTINLSYGAYAGPHDGTSILEEALDAVITRRRGLGGPTDIIIAAGNGADSDTHVEATLTAAGSSQAEVSFPWVNIPDNPTDQFTEVWLVGEGASPCEVRLTPPGHDASRSQWVAPGKSAAIERDGDVVAMVIAPGQVTQGRRGRMVLVVVAPTVRRGGRAAAPYGRWSLDVRNGGTGEVTVKAWIERDEPVFMSASGPRQARFGTTPWLRKDDTLNSVASGRETIVVGGLIGDAGSAPAYSARGPRPPAGAKQHPEWFALSDESDALPGVAAAAVIGTDRVRLPGTSVSAAVTTRAVVKYRKENGGTGQVPAPQRQPGDELPVVRSPLLRREQWDKRRLKEKRHRDSMSSAAGAADPAPRPS